MAEFADWSSKEVNCKKFQSSCAVVKWSHTSYPSSSTSNAIVVDCIPDPRMVEIEKLTEWPSDLPINASRILLNDNSVRFLKRRDFIAYTNLSFLDLARNGLERIIVEDLEMVGKEEGEELLPIQENGDDGHAVSTSIPRHTLPPFRSLTHLILSDNNLGRGRRRRRPSGLRGNDAATDAFKRNRHRLKDAGAFRSMFSLTHLWLDNNNLTFIGSGAFRDLTSLIFLNLEGNFLGPVLSRSLGGRRGSIFDSLISLETLNLSDNNIGRIVDNDLSSLSFAKLRSLDLSENRISNLPDFAFTKLISLKTLSLRRNRLTAVEPRAFQGLAALTLLDLGENRLLRIPDGFHLLSSLRRLFLDRNEFDVVRPRAFYPLNELIELYLHDNPRLETLQRDAFDGLYELKKCVLSDNPRLRLVDPVAFPVPGLSNIKSIFLNNAALPDISMNIFIDLAATLEFVDISDNPWKCDCRLRNLKSFVELEKKQIGVDFASYSTSSAAGANASSSTTTTSSSSSSLPTSSSHLTKSWRHRILRSQSLRCASPPNLLGVDIVSSLHVSQLTCSPPLILREPTSAKLIAIFGQTFHLRLRISGAGMPTVEWFDAAMMSLPRADVAATAVVGGKAGVVKVNGTRADAVIYDRKYTYDENNNVNDINDDDKNSNKDNGSSGGTPPSRLPHSAFQSLRFLSDGEMESTLSFAATSFLSSGKYSIVVVSAGGRINRTYFVSVTTERGLRARLGHRPHSNWDGSRSFLLLVLLCLVICFACIFQKQIDKCKYTPKRNSNA